MIATAFLNIFYLFIYGLTAPLRILSDVYLSANLTASIQSVNSYLSAVSFIFPVSTFITILGIILTIESFIILYKIINWLIRKIPTIN